MFPPQISHVKAMADSTPKVTLKEYFKIKKKPRENTSSQAFPTSHPLPNVSIRDTPDTLESDPTSGSNATQSFSTSAESSTSLVGVSNRDPAALSKSVVMEPGPSVSGTFFSGLYFR